jgi:predicted dinucleotide-binding enzyme
MDRTRPLPLLGIIGAGKVGSVLARQALRSGYRVLVADSGEPARLAMALAYLAPGAEACSAEDLASWADIVHLAIPLAACGSLPIEGLAGKIVIDGMNYWPQLDAPMADFEARPGASSEVVQALLPLSRVVKTLNHLGFHEIEEDARAPGSPGRRAIAMAGDDAGAKAEVAAFLSNLGFDSLDAGDLAQGWRFSPGQPAFGRRLDLEGLRLALFP